jgi:ABC-type polar amino acid transport system ATPase subunit
MTSGSWAGEEQTLDCLRKIMSKVEKYPYIVVKGNIQSGKSSLMGLLFDLHAYSQIFKNGTHVIKL